MFFFIGAVIVILSVFGGFAMDGGRLAVLWEPIEFIIIFGAACGAYVIGSPRIVLSKTVKAMKDMLAGSPYNKENYLEILGALYSIFKLTRTKGLLVLEQHIENPKESEIFSHFTHFHKQERAIEFLCDYLRLITLGGDNPHQMEDLMNEELEVHQEEFLKISHSIQAMADGMPALGIVAAVLGVIKTMGSIDKPPEVLGHSIAGALVGTFLGVFLSYGFIAPMASSVKSRYEEETKYLDCIKIAILAYLNGYAPAICIEFARKSILSNTRPTFTEVENYIAELPKFK